MPQINILYVEDYELVLFTVKQLLELEGWRVDVCRDGTTALKKIEGIEQYHLIVLDADLPGISGLELVRRARKLTHRRRTPIIIFTASEYDAEASAAGANALLKKPNGIRDLIPTIEMLINGQHSTANVNSNANS